MKKNTRSRKYQITINNPVKNGWTRDKIKKQLELFSSLEYYCMCDEVGENGTPHTHIYIALKSASSFSTVKKRFDLAHIEPANGTSQQNRDYITKTGKWEKDRKKETNLAETFEEFGEMPNERPGQRKDLETLYSMIKQGLTNAEIMEANSDYIFHLDKIERIRQTYIENKYKNEWRDVEVEYIFGGTATGKTSYVMNKYGFENVYRVTNYNNPFDGYKGQDVIIFEEFRSSLKIQDMLNFLDGYPLVLPCRYSDKQACYTKVYIITNIPLESQYEAIQEHYTETWDAFIRRIKKVHHFALFGKITELPIQNYFINKSNLTNKLPFDV